MIVLRRALVVALLLAACGPAPTSAPAVPTATPPAATATTTQPALGDDGPPVDLGSLRGRIAFVSASATDEDEIGIFVLTLGGPRPLKPERVTPDRPGESFVAPSWSPDGTQVTYQHLGKGDARPAAYVMNADGTQPQLVAADAATPVWSPDGSELAISNVERSHRGIAIVSLADAAAPRQYVTTVPDNVPEEYPVWSPDGQRLAFNSHRTGGCCDSDVWVVDRDGTNLVDLTNDPALDTSPAWSPDGTRIAFSSERTGGDVFLMDPDGSHVEQLTDHPEYDGGPVWSPDGRYIIFATRRTGLLAIWVMRADGRGETVLYDSPDEDLMMAWTPWATVPPAE